VRVGLNMPNFDVFADPATVVTIAREAERAGWDGVFVWDHINIFGEVPVDLADPWVLLTLIATATEQIAIGPMVTPVPRRRPWVLARQTATLDRVSHGRLILGVGLGFPPDTEFANFGEEADAKVRAQKLDEGLEILSGLWTGEAFAFSGSHYRVGRTRFLPATVQRPRPTVIVAGTWPLMAPLRRAARWDGYFPLRMLPDGEAEPLTPNDVREIKRLLDEARDGRPAEIVVSEESEGERLEYDRLAALAEAGATWYLDGLSTRHMSFGQLLDRIKAGPPDL
jgi:alkanesulfonate monooxygenase SsuD/methylene tetrahydromethanopterin reductase-like flavin-dependent oxidoreductase (luciferase family)